MQVKHFLTAAAFAAFCVPSHGAEVTKAVLGNIEATGNVVTDVSFTGLASEDFVKGRKWDWATQVTNKPSYVQKSGDTMTGNLTVSNEDAFVKVLKTGGKRDYYTTVKAGQLINSDADYYTATLTLPTVSGTLALLSDVPSVSGLASESWVNSHKWDWGTQVTNKPTNVSAFNNDAGYVTANHTHSNLVNGGTEIVANANGTGSIVRQTYTTEERWMSITFSNDFDAYWQGSGSVVHIYKDVAANQIVYVEGDKTVRHDLPLSLRHATPEEQEQSIDWIQVGYSADQLMDCWFYAGGSSSGFMSPNVGVSFTLDTGEYTYASAGAGYSFDHGTGAIWGGVQGEVEVPAGSVSETIATTAQIPVDYVSASTATNIAKQIIRNAVSGVNTNIQSAEDTRVALTNLITILKSL